MHSTSMRYLVGSISVLCTVACSGNKGALFDGPPVVDASSVGDGGSSSSVSGAGDNGDGGPQISLASGDAGSSSSGASECVGGHYAGNFAGSYSSNLIVGVPLAVTGNVDMTLNQAGSNETTCTFAGETQSCANFYKVEGGTVTGVANSNMLADASFGGYPYFCGLTGTLDCAMKKLVGGWIQCTYCVGQLADGGMMCAPLIAGLGGGIGGRFAGPVTANYDTNTHSFVDGTWNGAEALAGNDGGSPGPDGGSVDGYLALDGGYGIGNYGGSGTWGTALQ
jgi:hypothetical protein